MEGGGGLVGEEAEAFVEELQVLAEFGVVGGEELGASIPEGGAAEVAGAEAGVADEFEEFGAELGFVGVFDEGFGEVLGVFEFAFGEGFAGFGVGGVRVLGGQGGGEGEEEGQGGEGFCGGGRGGGLAGFAEGCGFEGL